MKSSRYQHGQILIIYLSTLFVGGSSLALGMLSMGKPLDDLVKSVEVSVTDDDRQQQVLDLLETWNEQGEIIQDKYQQQRERLLDLIEDHDARPSAFESEIKKILVMDESSASALLDIQYKLRENLTRSEWDSIMLPD